MLGSIRRLAVEYRSLGRVLSTSDFLGLLLCTAKCASHVLRTHKLTAVDAAMSRNLTVRYRGHHVSVPLADIDAMLVRIRDNPTFGNIREMYAADCYLRRFRVKGPVGVVLDLGANRGLFSLLALLALDAECVIGVEPLEIYEPVMALLLSANACGCGRVVRYNKLIGSRSEESADAVNVRSIDSIRSEQHIDRFGLVKIDIEGAEGALFSEPGWLLNVDAIAMELHPHLTRDLGVIPDALKKYGFRSVSTDDLGRACVFSAASYLYASRPEAALAL